MALMLPLFVCSVGNSLENNVDTHEISMHYRARPVAHADMPFGEWFCSAIHEYNPRLRGETSIDKCKSLILEGRYNERDNLKELLIEYNVRLCKEVL